MGRSVAASEGVLMQTIALVVFTLLGLIILPRITITVLAFCLHPFLGVVWGIGMLFTLGD
jgi:hypothetical protein